mgnify:CR=1 FL=1
MTQRTQQGLFHACLAVREPEAVQTAKLGLPLQGSAQSLKSRLSTFRDSRSRGQGAWDGIRSGGRLVTNSENPPARCWDRAQLTAHTKDLLQTGP